MIMIDSCGTVHWLLVATQFMYSLIKIRLLNPSKRGHNRRKTNKLGAFLDRFQGYALFLGGGGVRGMLLATLA